MEEGEGRSLDEGGRPSPLFGERAPHVHAKVCYNIAVNPLDPLALVLSIVATAIIFAVFAFLTRATPRRILGALIASTPLVLLILLLDRAAAQVGWWHYPAVTAGNAPLAWYVAAALGYGAAFGLIGWRVTRSFGPGGLAVFLVLFALFGLLRDYLHSVTDGWIVFGPGPIPLIADWLAYALAAALVQLLMYWIAGPPRSDPLARTYAFSRMRAKACR